jgi:hypothetical protein
LVFEREAFYVDTSTLFQTCTVIGAIYYLPLAINESETFVCDDESGRGARQRREREAGKSVSKNGKIPRDLSSQSELSVYEFHRADFISLVPYITPTQHKSVYWAFRT